MHMVAPTVDIASKVSDHNVPVYHYHFAPRISYHSVELNYVFGSPFNGKYADEMGSYFGTNFTEEDRKHSREVMVMWTQFAKHG